MAKTKKKGPPYLDTPDEKYVVVANPWGMVAPAHRKQSDVNVLGAWMRAVFGFTAGNIQAVYMMTTRDEVVVQLAQRVDILPGLGAHKWAKFLRPCAPRDAGKVSYIFEYDWRKNGAPGEHQWADWYPTDMMPPKGFPVVLPYPPSSWAAPSRGDTRLLNLVRPLPAPRVRTPTPPPTPVEPDAPQASAAPAFAPYQPPAHHPSHALSHYADPALNPAATNGADADVKPNVKQEPADAPPAAGPSALCKVEPNPTHSEVLQIGKLGKQDPYEEAEAAELLLRDNVVVKSEHSDLPVSVKKEEPREGRVPSAALVASLVPLEDTTRSTRTTSVPPPAIKPEPMEHKLSVLAEARRPSSALLDVLSHHQGPEQKALKREIDEDADSENSRHRRIKLEH